MSRSFFQLEPRLLFDASAADTADHVHDDGAHAQFPGLAFVQEDADNGNGRHVAESADPSGLEGADETASRVEIFVVDASVHNPAAIEQALGPDAVILRLDAETDGITALSEALAGYGRIDALHIFSHGSDGQVHLGSAILDDEALAERGGQIAGWADAFSEHGDIVLYGCEVAASQAGQAFAVRLADLTRTDVAASTDPTGSADQGGNWDMEFKRGPIETRIVSVAAYDRLLADTTLKDTATTPRVTPEDTALPITGLTLADADNPDDMTLHVKTTGGISRITLQGSVSISAGNNGSADLTLRGSLADLQSTLNTLTFTPTANKNSATPGYESKIVLTGTDVTNDGTPTSLTVKISVSPVNDAPDLSTRVSPTVSEGGTVSFELKHLAETKEALDPDIATGQQVLEQLMVEITSLPAQGKLTYRGGVVAVGAVVPVTDLTALQYTHDGTDLTQTTPDSFTVTVHDGGGGATEGQISINVTPENKAPKIDAKPIDILEGQVKVVAPDIDLGDAADTLATSTIVIDTVKPEGQGRFFFDGNNNNKIDPGEELTGTTTLTPAQAANIATRLKFFHNGAEPNAPGAVAPSFQITVTDSGGGLGVGHEKTTTETITLNVEPVNDDPYMENHEHSTAGEAWVINERETVSLTEDELKITDVDRDPTNVANTTPPAQLVYTVTSVPEKGELRLQTGLGYAVLGVGGRFTQDDINNNRVTYVQTTGIPDGPNVSDKFTFTVRDSAFGYDMSDPANPGNIREGAIRNDDGTIKTHEFHFSITPKVEGDGEDPQPPTISYNFASNPNKTNDPTPWNEANVAAPDGRYLLNKNMLEYVITRINETDHSTEELDPQEVVYTLTSVPGNGVIYQNDGTRWVPMAVGSVFTQADINGGRIGFVSDGSETHTSSFGFTVSDGTVAGTTTGSFNIVVTPTNDRPVATGGAAQVGEGANKIVRLDGSVIGMSDVDTNPASDALWFQISTLPAHGTLQRWNGTSWVDVVAGQWLSQDILTAVVDDGTSGLRYVHDGSEPLAYVGGPKVTFAYTVRDDLAAPAPADRFSVNTSPVAATMPGGGAAQSHQSNPATATVNILPKNNPPQVADKPGDDDPTISGTISGGGETTGKNVVLANVSEGGLVTITKAYLTAIDPDNTTVQRQYRITQAVEHGWLLLDGKALGKNSTFTQKHIDEGRLQYRHDGGEFANPVTDTLGTYNDKFHFIVSDGVLEDTGTPADKNVFLITFSEPRNDIPVLTPEKTSMDALKGADVYVDVPKIGVSDADLDTITDGETDFLRAEIRVLDEHDAPITTAKLTYTAADPSSTASGGAFVSGKESNALVVQGTRAEVQNILNSLQLAMTEDRDSTTDKIQVVVDDRLRDSTGSFKLVGGKQVANGGKLNEIEPGGSSTLAEVNATNNRVSVDISLRSSIENDPPGLTNPGEAYTVHEDQSVILNGFTLTDADSFDENVTVRVELFNDATRTPEAKADAAKEGKLVLGDVTGVSASGDTSNTVTLTGKMADVQAALNKLKFQGAPDYNGPDRGYGTLYLRTTFTDFKHGAESTAHQSVKVEQRIIIVPVNDVPILNVPGNKVLKEGSSIAITSGFAVSDIKDTTQGATDFITVTLTAKDKDSGALYGTLQIQTPGAATVTDNNTSTVKVSGTAAAVQAALNSLVYTPDNANVDKIITITAVADDRHPAGTGKGNGAEGVGDAVTSLGTGNTVTQSFTIIVSNINNAPTVTGPSAPITIPEDTSLIFDGGTGAGHAAKIVFADRDTFGSANNTVTISAPVGKVSVALFGTTIVGGANNSGAITLKGSLDNINAALATLMYTPDPDYNSTNPVRLTAEYNDQGNVGSGGSKTVTATVDIIVTPVNDAPTRTEQFAILGGITEDMADPPGDTIQNLVSPKFQDLKDDQEANSGSSSNTFYGVVVVGNTATNAQGVWQYHNGTTWTNMPDVSVTNGFVLKPEVMVRFKPASGWGGDSGELITRLIETGGATPATGDRLNVTNSGGTTMYSDADNEVHIITSVVNVNDPGRVYAENIIVDEGGSSTTDGSSITVSLGAAGITVTDDDHDGKEVKATVTVTKGFITGVGGSGGSVTGAGPSSQKIVITGTMSQINSRLNAVTVTLPGTNKADWNGSFDVTVVYNDQGNSGRRPGSIWHDNDDPSLNPGDFAYLNPEDPNLASDHPYNATLITTRTITVTVNPVNDAPKRTDATPVLLPAVAEDSPASGADAPGGETVENLFKPKFDDTEDAVPGGSLAHNFAGIAVTTNNAIAAQGTWQYSDDNGNTWTDLPTVSNDRALLLRPADKLRFVPASDFHGRPGGLTVRLVDSSGGAVAGGTFVDVSGSKSGGITPYSNSANAVILNTAVAAVNDRPIAADAALPDTVEDNADPPGHVLSSLDFGFSDATDDQSKISGGGNAAGTFGGIAIVGNAANRNSQGVWQYNAGSGWVDIGCVDSAPSDSSAVILPATGQLRFVPVENYNGTPGGLNVRVADTAQIAGTGQDISGDLGQTSTWSEVVTLRTGVIPQNDAPTMTHTPTNPTFTEDGNTGLGTATAVKLLNSGEVFDLDLTTTPGLDRNVFGKGTIIARLIIDRPTDGIVEGDRLEHDGPLPAGVTFTGGTSSALVINLDEATTLDQVKGILEKIQYKHVSDNPDNYGQNPTRTYRIELRDGNNVQDGGDAGGPGTLETVATGTITITPVNDPPTATNNTNEVFEDADPNTATGNVRTDGTPDSDPDNTLDELYVSAIRTGPKSGTGTAGTLGVRFASTYGHLTMNSDGSYVYELDNINSTVNALRAGETLTETFTYTLSDPGGLTDTADLTITIHGSTDGEPRITPVDGNAGAQGHADVYESGLTPDGPSAESKEVSGILDWAAPAGLVEITIGGQTFTVAELKAFTLASPSEPITTTQGELRLIGLTGLEGAVDKPTKGKLSYTYTLRESQDHLGGSTESTDDIALSIKDVDPLDIRPPVPGALIIRIVDDVPTARDDSAQMCKYDATVTGKVTTNDRLGADSPITVTAFSFTDPDTDITTPGVLSGALDGYYGSLTLNADGTYFYELDKNNPDVAALQYSQTLTETFSYTITDADGDTSTAKLVITIDGSDVPTAVDDSYTTSPGGTVSGNLADNDTPSRDDGGNTWTVTTNPAHGTVVLNPDGTFTYTAPSDYAGVDSFTYTITDADGDTSMATVTIRVDDVPGAVDDNFSTSYDTPVSGNLAGNDRPSLDGGNTWAVTTGPANGTVVLNPDGTFIYMPTPGFSGSDSFTYTITDKDGNTSTATVIIAVGAPHHGGNKPGVSPLPLGPSTPSRPGFGETGDPFSPVGDGAGRLPTSVTDVFRPNLTMEQRILARALELSEFPRRLEIAYVQWIDLRFGQERSAVDLPPQALSVLTGTEIRAEAKLADGSPLPFWITFDLDARALLVTPPEGLREKSVTVKVWLWDEKGNEAVVTVALNLDDVAGQAAAGRNSFWETEQTIVAGPGKEVAVSLQLEPQHTEMLAEGRLRVAATLADGSPLPKGLELNPATGEVSGKIVGTAEETVLEVRVIITDEHGTRSEVIHSLRVVPGEGHVFVPPQGRASFTAQLAACMC